MKPSIWDILTGLLLLGILCMLGFFGMILLNPSTPLNPLKPLATVRPIFIPSATLAPTKFQLPPTWTPTPRPTSLTEVEEVGVPTLRASSTPEPTSTVVVLPTFTPSKTVRAGGPGGPGIGGGACQVVYQNPADDTVISSGEFFSTRWTVKNTSTEPWPRDSIDIRFQGGDRVHTSPDAEDLDYGVPAGGATDIIIDMVAPREPGTKTSNWALMDGDRALCRFYVTFKVK